MNENQVKPTRLGEMEETSQTKIYEFISLMERQNKELDDLIMQVANVSDRIDGVANRLNSSEYPKNFPKDVSTDVLKDGCVPKSSSTGLILALENVTAEKRRLIDSLDHNVLVNLREGLTYLERHI